jgi:predicted Na+-dependent transporter
MSRVFKTIPLLLGTSIVAFGSISLVGGLLGEHEGEELFHGQAYFSQTVTPVLYVLFLMSWVGVGANHCIVKWKRDRKTRHGIAGLCLILGIMFGLVGLMGMTKGIESQIVFLMVGFLMALLGYVIYNVNYIVGKPE